MPLKTISLSTLASRERFLSNLNKFPLPPIKVQPTAKAGVLVPICHTNNSVSLLYTVRSLTLRTNSGQISFPGGKCDENESIVDTALRETEEEIGLPRQRIEVWCQAPTVPGRNNAILITPIVGFIDQLSEEELKINSKEVAKVFTAPLEELCESGNHYHTQFRNGFILPVFAVGDHKIWGITAYITHVILSCILPKDIYKNDWIKKKVVKYS